MKTIEKFEITILTVHIKAFEEVIAHYNKTSYSKVKNLNKFKFSPDFTKFEFELESKKTVHDKNFLFQIGRLYEASMHV